MNRDELLNIAILSKLEIKDDEVEEILNDMEKIIKFTEKINACDVSSQQFRNINPLQNVFRKDEVLESFPQEEILKNAKTKEDGFFYLKNRE